MITWARIAAGLALAAALFGTGWGANGWRLGQQIAEIERGQAQRQAETSRRVAQAQATERAEEARRVDAQQEVVHVATVARDRAEDDRRRADAMHRSLLDDARAYAARDGRQDPAAAECSQAAGPAAVVLADVLGGADEAAGDLAAALDRASIAGAACERAYDALKPPTRSYRDGGL